MRRIAHGWFLVPACAAASFWSVSGSAADSDNSGLVTDISVAEIMESVVMPAAQILWDAVGVSVTSEGIIETKPETDEDWAKLRGAAITLAAITNALVVPGRHAAPPGTQSEAPDVELQPAEIEALIEQQHPAWVAHATVLHATAMQALAAVDARDTDKITEVGGAIDEACEGCHIQFWYPNQQ